MVERATHTLAARAAPTKNGIRQPQASRAAGASRLTVSADTPTANKAPTSLAADAEEGVALHARLGVDGPAKRDIGFRGGAEELLPLGDQLGPLGRRRADDPPNLGDAVSEGLIVEVAELERIDAFATDPAIDLVKRQIKEFHADGFEIGLHLHPQWFKSRYDNGRWFLNFSEYNLCNLPEKRIAWIVERSLAYLRHLVDQADFTPLSFRAGNWLFQPTEKAASDPSAIVSQAESRWQWFHELTPPGDSQQNGLHSTAW